MIRYQYHFLSEEAKTIILIHGWNTSSLYMEGFVTTFKDKYNVLSLDLFKEIDKKYDVDLFVNEIRRIIRKLKIKNPSFIGHSFGGKISYFYSLKYKVDKLILIAPSLIKPRFNILKYLKIKMYKILKKFRMKIPRFLQGSKDFKSSKGYMKVTFLECYKKYIEEKDDRKNTIIIYGFNKDKEVKKYQIKNIIKYIPRAKIIMLEGNHFSYLDYIKEIRLGFEDHD